MTDGQPHWTLPAAQRAQLRLLSRLDPKLYASITSHQEHTEREKDREVYEGSLLEFFKRAWREIDSARLNVNWHHEVICEHLEDITFGRNRDLIINIPPRHSKSLMVNVIWPAWVWSIEPGPDLPLAGPQVKFLSVSYSANLAEDMGLKMLRLVSGAWYQGLWGERVKLLYDKSGRADFENSSGGRRMSNSIEGGVLGMGADCRIVDDPQTRKIAESEPSRRSSLAAMSDLSTRVTDPRIAAQVLIQQRLHVRDATDWALNNWPKSTIHLMFPARFEPDRCCPEDRRTQPGELLWPAVWTNEELTKIENGLAALDGEVLSDYACNPAEAPILMADLSDKAICDVRVGDQVVGFEKDLETERPGNSKLFRRRLTPATVTGVFRRRALVVKITLDSGEVIRCTPDHKWFSPWAAPGKSEYLPARVGRKLARVCDPRLPVLSGEDLRQAGWLSGFFDGEGTASLSRKKGGFRAASSIIFYQGAGRNLPLCDLLEKILSHFGFEWGMTEFIRSDRKSGDDSYKNRFYRIFAKKRRLDVMRNFLHIADPHKWRERLIEAALSTKWIRGRERVVSIEPDGIEDVYALETTTGNYIAWGLASSNSAGQLQQNPKPRGGGIVNDDDWAIWPEWVPKAEDMTVLGDGSAYVPLPPVSHVILSLDTALSEKETADWNACVILGIWHRPQRLIRIVGQEEDVGIDDGEQPRVIVMGAWRRRCKLNDSTIGRDGRPLGLVQLVADTCRRYPVNRIIIENKTRGLDVSNELQRQFADEDYHIQMFEPGRHGDKAARLYAVQPLFSQGLVYLPARCMLTQDYLGNEVVETREFEWARLLLDEVSQVPRGSHDDLADGLVQGLLTLRDDGLISLTKEYVRQQVALRMRRGSKNLVRDSYGV